MNNEQALSKAKRKRVVKTVVATRNCIVKAGAVCEVMDTDGGFWLILKVDGVKVPSNWSVFLVEGRDFCW